MNLFSWSVPFVSEKIIDIYSELYKHIKKIEDEEISSDKFIKALNDVKNDDDLKDKIVFLERKRQESLVERKKKEKEIKEADKNITKPEDLNYENKDLEKEFETIKLTDSLHESRMAFLDK